MPRIGCYPHGVVTVFDGVSDISSSLYSSSSVKYKHVKPPNKILRGTLASGDCLTVKGKIHSQLLPKVDV